MSPTFHLEPRFERDLEGLSPQQRETLERAVAKFIDGLRSGQMPRGLRVKGVQGAPGVFELSWAPDGRATFSFGNEVTKGEAHVIWRRVGTHAILGQP